MASQGSCYTSCYDLTGSNEWRHEETNDVVSEQVRHKPSCTSTEDG